MLQNKHVKSLLPGGLLWRLTFINIFIVGSFIVLSSLAMYNTACYLANDMGTAGRQNQFDSILFQYLLIFSTSAIVVGSLIHFYLTRKLIRPLRRLIASTKSMKKGRYPIPLETSSEDEIGQLTGHFNDLIQQLKNNQEHRQKLVADISHEIRTPLSNLEGYLNALDNGMLEGNPDLHHALHMEAKRLTGMVDQLDQLKEWDYITKQTLFEQEPVDIYSLIAHSVDLFQWTAQEEGIVIDVETDSGTAYMNNEGIQQVVNNLLDNAIRYYRGKSSVVIKGENQETKYKVSISGEGQDIPSDKRDVIFERFYRIDPARARDSGGTGLGLAISKEIVEHHKGEIGLISDGNYHTFWFTIPLL